MKELKDYLPQSVRNKNILITGATTGIGRATAVLLAQTGANLMHVGRNPEHMKDALEAVSREAEGKVYGVLADLGTEEGIARVFEVVDSQFSKIDVLINNVGLPSDSITDGAYRDWEYVLKTNLLSYMACSAEAIKRMKNKGHIVNIGSMSADVREDSGSVYVATKAGVQAFSESLRKELNPQGIKITLIEPGAVDTDMQEDSTEEKRKKIQNFEMLTSEDIALSILYCLSQPERCDVVELKIRPHRQFI